MAFNTKNPITEDTIENLLCSAIEGGSNYWADIRLKAKHENYLDAVKAGDIEISDVEGDEEIGELSVESIQKGLDVMSEKYPWHIRNILTENDDAETGDVLLQCSTLGDIVFG